jgi:uncharacterized protein YcsI (UPF0317 family)
MNPQNTTKTAEELAGVSGAEVRAAIRAGEWTGPTAGLARGYAQANLVILPAEYADEFYIFCRRNPRPCPLLEKTAPGDPHPRLWVAGADLRTDVPRYRIFRDGKPDEVQPTDISDLWRDDLVCFLLGCSFTFENALMAAGHRIRHIDEGRNVPMYRTNNACWPGGRFACDMVMSMRPFPAAEIDDVIAITGRFSIMHGAPMHVGNPASLGLVDLARPDFGDAVTIYPGEVPAFWACGVTPQLAICEAGCKFAITHSPGCMFVTDRLDSELMVPLTP